MLRVVLVKSGRGSACLGVASIAVDIGHLARTVLFTLQACANSEPDSCGGKHISCILYIYIQTNWFLCTNSGLPVGTIGGIGARVNIRMLVTRTLGAKMRMHGKHRPISSQRTEVRKARRPRRGRRPRCRGVRPSSSPGRSPASGGPQRILGFRDPEASSKGDGRSLFRIGSCFLQ